MKTSELIKELEIMMKKHGDLKVYVDHNCQKQASMVYPRLKRKVIIIREFNPWCD